MNQIQAAKAWRVQVNTSSYGRFDLPEALERECLPYKKLRKPEIFFRGGAHLDTEFSNLIKQNIVRNNENGDFQVQVIILGDYLLVLEKTEFLMRKDHFF